METYVPVSESFQDEINAFAKRKEYIKIQYFSDIHEYITRMAVIKKVYLNESNEQFIELNIGDIVRVDKIVRINDRPAPGYFGIDDFTCDC